MLLYHDEHEGLVDFERRQVMAMCESQRAYVQVKPNGVLVSHLKAGLAQEVVDAEFLLVWEEQDDGR